jgi:SAM dependent carboxyl methyltransferase
MAERTLSFVNVAMWSGGYYSTATKGAKDVIDGATKLVLDAIRRMPDNGSSNSFTFTGMGCADGGTSIDLVRQAVGAVRARWPQRPITVVYSDQPRNDYNSLFHLIHGSDFHPDLSRRDRGRICPGSRDVILSAHLARGNAQPRILRDCNALAQPQALRPYEPCPGRWR